MASKKRALLSVSDKRFITTFARDLIKYGYELVSTGGTFKKLKEASIPCKELSRVFKTPEILDGRVKTLHAHVHASILADLDKPSHVKQLQQEGLQLFDMVVVNFYPFGEKVKPGKTALTDAVEFIDIGGPTMVRAAAKNYRHVAIVSSVDQYRDVTHELKESGDLTEAFRLRLARDAFHATSQFDLGVAAFFDAVAPKDVQPEAAAKAEAPVTRGLPPKLTLELKQLEKLRYGENPHQEGARYRVSGMPVLGFKVLQGKDMSYNNYLDASAALGVVSVEYTEPCTACVVKHLNPCGIAVGADPVKTFITARDADERSAFGGVVALNYPVTGAVANELKRTFLEIVIAPSIDSEARDILASKTNLRVIEADPLAMRALRETTPKLVVDLLGAMMQSQDVKFETWDDLQIVSDTQPKDEHKSDILLGLKFIRFLRSNALCVVKNGVMVGRGLGQMSRVDACEIALSSAGKRAQNAVLVSDGFFPFADSVELAAKAKIGCVVSPAGSKRDMEVVATANKLKLPLIFSPYRHFWH